MVFGIASIKDLGDVNETLKRVYEKGEENFKHILNEVQLVKNRIMVLETSGQKDSELPTMQMNIEDMQNQLEEMKDAIESVIRVVNKAISQEEPKPVPKSPIEELEEVRETVKKTKRANEEETGIKGYCLNCEDDRPMRRVELADSKKGGKMFRGRCVECGRIIYRKYDKELAAVSGVR